MSGAESRIPQPPPGRRASPEGLPSGVIIMFAVAVLIFVVGVNLYLW